MANGYASAIGSHVGMVRANNQDSGYAGDNLFLVADGMGGHAGGDVASAMVAHDMAKLDLPPVDSATASAEVLRLALLNANTALRDTVKDHHELAGLGTTFVGFLTVGDQLSVAHIGDSRLYLFREGVLQQITKDHTFVQRLVDSGRITEEEAQYHPRRSVLMRVLGDVESSPEIDTMVLDTEPDDIWLLCSDGLCGYVSDDEIEKILRRKRSLQGAVDDLIDKSLSHGAPDNVTVVLVETTTAAECEAHERRSESTPHIGDTIELTGSIFGDGDSIAVPTPVEEKSGPKNPRFVGSSANAPQLRDGTTSTARTRLANRRRIRRVPLVEESHFEPRVDEYLAELLAETKRSNRRRRIMWLIGVIAVLAAIGGALLFGYQWTQTRYFVGTDGDTVIIYQGVHQDLGSLSLYSPAENTGLPLEALDGLERRTIERTLSASSLKEAREIVARLGGITDGD